MHAATFPVDAFNVLAHRLHQSAAGVPQSVLADTAGNLRRRLRRL
jgi:hypothetical protein